MVGVLASPGKTISGVNVYIVCIKVFRSIVYESKYFVVLSSTYSHTQ